MSKPILEIPFEIGGQTKNMYFFTAKNESSNLFFPKKIYISKDILKEPIKIITLTITEKEK